MLLLANTRLSLEQGLLCVYLFVLFFIALWFSVLVLHHSGWKVKAAIGLSGRCLRANACRNSITLSFSFCTPFSFPRGSLGLAKQVAEATCLSGAESQMSTRGSCSQMCMLQMSADVGMWLPRHFCLAGCWHLLCPGDEIQVGLFLFVVTINVSGCKEAKYSKWVFFFAWLAGPDHDSKWWH